MQWHQLDRIQTICTSLQTDNHTNTLLLNFYRPDALPDAELTVSKHWKHTAATRYAIIIAWYQKHWYIGQVNWSVLAETILRNYTREVYLATKNRGWDGRLSHLYDPPVLPVQTLTQARTCPTCKIHLSHLYTHRHSLRHVPVQPARYTCLTCTLPCTFSGTHMSQLQLYTCPPLHPRHSLRHAPVPPVWGHRGRGGGGDVTVGHGRVAAVRHHRYHYDRYTYDAIHLHIYRGPDGAMAHTKCGPTAQSSQEFFSQ